MITHHTNIFIFAFKDLGQSCADMSPPFFSPVPSMAMGRARTPLPAISPARKTPAVMTPSPPVVTAAAPFPRAELSLSWLTPCTRGSSAEIS